MSWSGAARTRGQVEAQAGQLWRDGGKKAERGEARVWRKAHSVRLTHGPGLAAAQGGREGGVRRVVGRTRLEARANGPACWAACWG